MRAQSRARVGVSFRERWSSSSARNAFFASAGGCSTAARIARRSASDFETFHWRAIRSSACMVSTSIT
jgi:hypothetical protein